MVVATIPVEPANVLQALVNKLLDVFDATRDLYQTLTVKEQRDYELSLRSKGYPASRRIEYVADGRLGSDEAIVLDKAAVTRQFEIGHQAIGADFVVGDVLAHTSLQSQIITLQGVLITTFLYGPTSSKPVSQQLANINQASREAGTATVDILSALQHRQQEPRAPSTHSRAPTRRSSPVHILPPPIAPTATSTTSTALTPYHKSSRAQSRSRALTGTVGDSASTALTPYHAPAKVRSGSPVNTTIFDRRDMPLSGRNETITTSISSPTSQNTQPPSDDLYCLYALDLQRHHTQPLSASIMSDSSPHCPDCKTTLHLSPGKAWEIFKEDDGFDRCFQVANRFVVKCHRAGPDGQYACVLCAINSPSHTICGDVKALIKHVWEDHSIRELKREVDIAEVIEQPEDRRRDSGLGYSTSRSSRKSRSVASSRRRRTSLSGYEREVNVFEGRSFRRHA